MNAGRESNVVVFLTGLGLALMAALVAYLSSLDGSVEDCAELLGRSYAVEAWPFDLQPHSAATLPLGERVLRLTRERGVSEDSESPSVSGTVAEADGKPIVWSRLPVGAKDQPPAEAALVWYPQSLAAGALEKAFGSLSSDGPEDLKPAGGPVVVHSERVAWGSLEVPLVHERRYGPGAVFHDSVRANISSGGQTCLLFVSWDPGLPGSVGLAREVLGAIRPLVAR